MTTKPQKKKATTGDAKKTTAETPQESSTEAPKPGKPNPDKLPIIVNAQYIKDLSFEAPSAPEIFSKSPTQQPDVNINVEVKAQPLQEKNFEVILHINVECTYEKKVAFILELVYGGTFTLQVPPEHLQPVLLIECPRLLFPFARNILAGVSRDGGFPPLMLGPLDFVAMYQNKIRQLVKDDNGGAAKKVAANPEQVN